MNCEMLALGTSAQPLSAPCWEQDAMQRRFTPGCAVAFDTGGVRGAGRVVSLHLDAKPRGPHLVLVRLVQYSDCPLPGGYKTVAVPLWSVCSKEDSTVMLL